MTEKRPIPRSVSRRLSERDRAAQPAAPPDLAALPGSLREFFSKLGEAARALGGSEDGTLANQGEVPFSIGGQQGRAVFGYTVRMGLNGPRAEPFGDMRPPAGATARASAAPAPAVRAPIVDLFEENGEIRVVAELPGAAAADISCTLQPGLLRIETGGPVLYRKDIALPTPVDPASLMHSCHHGILEGRLRRAAVP